MLEKYIAPTNLLPIRFGGLANKPLLALIDIGAMMNIISVFVYDEFSLPYVIISTLFSAFNSTFINIMGIIEMDIYIVRYYDYVIFFIVN